MKMTIEIAKECMKKTEQEIYSCHGCDGCPLKDFTETDICRMEAYEIDCIQ